VSSASNIPDCIVAQVRPVFLTDQTGLMLLHLHLRFFGLGYVDQPTNLVVFW
jgi:hypothetical protein